MTIIEVVTENPENLECEPSGVFENMWRISFRDKVWWKMGGVWCCGQLQHVEEPFRLIVCKPGFVTL